MTAIERHSELMVRESVTDLSADDALSLISELVDLSLDVRSDNGLNKAIGFATDLQQRSLSTRDLADVQYFLGNARSNLHQLVNRTSAWEDSDLERAILHYRTALSKEEWVSALPKERRCQVLTNLASGLSDAGR